MCTLASTYLCYPKPDSRFLPSGSSVVGFERHEDTLAWWEGPYCTEKAYFKSDAYWEEQRCKAAFLAKYPKSPPHPARLEPTPEFFRDYEKFIAMLACIQGIYLTRAGVHFRALEYNAVALAAAAATQEAVDALMTHGFLSAWMDLPIEAVRRMGTQTSGPPAMWAAELADEWLTAQADYADGPTTYLGSWGHNPSSPTSSALEGGGWGTVVPAFCARGQKKHGRVLPSAPTPEPPPT
ncbi:hypothetical protein C8R43DRAFT_1120875 [Mycena crocata]|nr:hypothetical protein C8R43DRAFT_1120875 [Mycena crocata]